MKSRIPASLLALAPAVSAGVFVVMFAVSASAPVAAAPEKSRGLRITKECSNYSYLAGDFCTITSSNLDEIPVDSTITYDQAFGIPAGMLDSNVVLDAGNGNWAVGRCTLVGATGRGRVPSRTAQERSPASVREWTSRLRTEASTGSGREPTASTRSTAGIGNSPTAS